MALKEHALIVFVNDRNNQPIPNATVSVFLHGDDEPIVDGTTVGDPTRPLRLKTSEDVQTLELSATAFGRQAPRVTVDVNVGTVTLKIPEVDVRSSDGAPVRDHVVLLLHGIRTQAEWAERAATVLESGDPTIRAAPIRYGFFDIISFLLPISAIRQRPVRRFAKQARTARDGQTTKLSVVAHSFGTYIVAKILEQEADIRFHRLILCGGIIPNEFEWEHFSHRLDQNARDRRQVVNDCGMKDIWPVMAQSITWGYGSSGRFGFGQFLVKDRFFNVGHSGFFKPTFVETYWLPYISNGEIVEGELDRATTPWWISLITRFRLKYLLLLLLVYMISGPLVQRYNTRPIPADGLEVRATMFLPAADVRYKPFLNALGTENTVFVGDERTPDRSKELDAFELLTAKTELQLYFYTQNVNASTAFNNATNCLVADPDPKPDLEMLVTLVPEGTASGAAFRLDHRRPSTLLLNTRHFVLVPATEWRRHTGSFSTLQDFRGATVLTRVIRHVVSAIDYGGHQPLCGHEMESLDLRFSGGKLIYVRRFASFRATKGLVYQSFVIPHDYLSAR